MDDREFLAAFEAAAIPAANWAHADHVRMAFLYLRDRPFDEAVDCIRRGIIALNRANGVVSTPTGGYHETITVAWAHVIAATIEAHGQGPSETFAAFGQNNAHLLAKSLLRLYYSKPRVLSPEARAVFVAPDLAPLPIARAYLRGN